MLDYMTMDKRIDTMTNEEKMFYMWRLTSWYSDLLDEMIKDEPNLRCMYNMVEHRRACDQIHNIITEELF